MKVRAILFAAAAVLLAGCASEPKAPPAQSPQLPVGAMYTAPDGTSRPVASVTVPAHLDPRHNVRVHRSVYFAYDEHSIVPEYKPVVELHGKYLAANPQLSIRVEGNADERGSSEYNLALGHKRAQAVIANMVTHGAKFNQMEPISWGKEKPVANGHDEKSWAMNRRADVVYPAR